MFNPLIRSPTNFIYRYNLFGIVFRNRQQVTKLPILHLFVGNHVGRLNIKAFACFVADKKHLPPSDLADGNIVSSGSQVHKNYIFQIFVNIRHQKPDQGMADSSPYLIYCCRLSRPVSKP